MRKILLFMLLLSLTALCTLNTYAQETQVTGLVTGENNQPLQGVSVTLKGSTHSVITNVTGYYSIKVSGGGTLVFTNVGYQKQEVAIGSQKTININLKPDTRNLSEVVVTAFGVAKEKRGLSVSTQNLKGEELSQTQRENFFNSLQGRIAGATVNATSGAPGASSQIVLRGVNSLTGQNSPLIIVDGLPINNNSFDQHLLASNLDNRSDDYTNRAADINPDEIESVNILKGPEATALYGIMAGSGAIVITTKKAKAGKLKVSYDNSFRVTHVYRYPEVQQVYDNGVNGATSATTSTRLLLGAKYVPGTVLFDNIHGFFEDGFAQKHTLSLEGGSGKTGMRGDVTIRDEKGVVPHTGLNSISSRFTINNKPSNKVDLTATISLSYNKNDKAFRGAGGFLQNLMLWPQDDDARNWLDANGKRRKILAGSTAELDNPYFDVNKNHTYDRTYHGIFNFAGVYNVTSWWDITARAGADFYSQYGNIFWHPESNLAYTIGGQVEEYTERYLGLSGVFISTFKKNIGKFKNTLRVGVADDDWTKSDFSRRGRGLKDSVTSKISNATIVVDSRLTGADTLTQKRLQGVFGEFNVSYNDIVYLNVTGRNDWSSTLPFLQRSFFYPSIGGAFIFSDLIARNSKILTFGKLRASYAKTAKDIQPYGSQSWYTPASGQTNGYGWLYDFYNNNPHIQPETQKTYEVGAELKFFDSRFNIDATYYDTRNIGQIVRLVRLSYGTGYVLNTNNIADTKNTGIEVTMSVTPVRNKNLTWTTTFNFAKTENKITKLPGNIPEFYNSDTWIGNYRAGLTRNGTITQMTGQGYLKNNQGQYIISPTTGLPVADGNYQKIGDRNPDFTMGVVNSINFRNRVSLSFLIDIRKGGDILNANELWMVQNGLSMRTLDRETPRIIPGVLNDGLQNSANPTPNNIPIVPMYNSAYYTAATYATDYVEHDVNWLRLRDVTLRYIFGPRLLRSLRAFSYADVFVTATDVFLITNYSGVDPTAGGNNAATSGGGSFGIDYGSLPTPRGINFGVKVQFANKK